MSLGLYNAASAMMTRMAELDLVAHNLANLNTPGYRAVRFSHAAFPNALEQRLPLGVTLGEQRVDLTPGPLSYTGNPLDVAIEGEGFFAVQTPQGVLYTRKGNFTLSPEGRLVTAEGYPVLGEDGQPLFVGRGEEVHITADGQVQVEGKPVGRLQRVTFAEPKGVRPVGEGLYGGSSPRPAEGRVVQGALEGSNVRPVLELVRFLSALRSYEMAARSLQSLREAAQALQEAIRG